MTTQAEMGDAVALSPGMLAAALGELDKAATQPQEVNAGSQRF